MLLRGEGLHSRTRNFSVMDSLNPVRAIRRGLRSWKCNLRFTDPAEFVESKLPRTSTSVLSAMTPHPAEDLEHLASLLTMMAGALGEHLGGPDFKLSGRPNANVLPMTQVSFVLETGLVMAAFVKLANMCHGGYETWFDADMESAHQQLWTNLMADVTLARSKVVDATIEANRSAEDVNIPEHDAYATQFKNNRGQLPSNRRQSG